MRVLCIVGARPNFMKMVPVVRALESCGIEAPLVHTGQHYEQGTNRLVGLNQEAILQSVSQVLAGDWPKGRVPDLWDGKASFRLSAVLKKWGGSGNREH